MSLADQDLTAVGVSDDLLDQSREEELEDPEEKRGLTRVNDRLEKDSKSAEDTSEGLNTVFYLDTVFYLELQSVGKINQS